LAETGLHPDLWPALAWIIIRARASTQVWVVTRASRYIAALQADRNCHSIQLEKDLGLMRVMDQGFSDEPIWYWQE